MIVAVNDKGREIASKLALKLNDEICQLGDIESRWNTEKHIIFIGAMGICVRSIAPFIKDKHTDPAVVCVDSLGKNVISVLSGHVGGANELTSPLAYRLLQSHKIEAKKVGRQYKIAKSRIIDYITSEG